jgi:DNA-binding transcriptional LysR family regulator
MIPLEALQAVDSIDRKGSFAAAAEELYRVPSAITYTIKKLEEQLNIKLFDRQGQRAKLTPTGRLILEEGREILRQVQRLEEQAKRIETGWESELRITVDTILPIYPLYPLINELQSINDALNIRIKEESLSGSWEQIVNQETDVLIGVTGDEPAGGHWHKQALGQIHMDVYCGNEHPAAQLPGPIEYTTLEKFVQITISDSARNLPQRTVGMLGLKQILAVPTMAQKIEALVNNIGISHLPRYFGEQEVKKGSLKRLVFDADPYPQTLYIVWSKTNDGKANQWLREAVIEQDIFKNCLQ